MRNIDRQHNTCNVTKIEIQRINETSFNYSCETSEIPRAWTRWNKIQNSIYLKAHFLL